MNPPVPRFARPRAGIAAAFALTGVLFACQTPLPTRADIERSDPAAAPLLTHELLKVAGADQTPAGGRLVIARPHRHPAQVALTRRPELTLDESSPMPALRERETDQIATGPAPVIVVRGSTVAVVPLMFIDGERADQSDVQLLDPSRIESVEVIKGAAAVRYYDLHPDAANGVILITTKRGIGTR